MHAQLAKTACKRFEDVLMIKNFLRNILLGERATSKKFVAYLRKCGVKIGDSVKFYSPSNTLVDVSAPYLLTIGNNVIVAHGVIILTHDYSWAVFKKIDGRVLGAQSPVKIGNNVFIGMNALIARGVTVGDNVIIGAGSVVTRDCESDGVYVGNPAKRIMSIDEFRAKREAKQFQEAKTLVVEYKNRYGENPPMELLFEYFMLFCTAEEAEKNPQFNKQMRNCDNFDDSIAYMKTHTPMFENYDAFLKACFE